MTQTHILKTLNKTTRQKGIVTIVVTSDPYCIEDTQSHTKFCGENIYECFNKFNAWLQNTGWIPLCNGARIDAALSGMAADCTDGSSVYLTSERDENGLLLFVDIFGEATESTVSTIEQQREYKNKKMEKMVKALSIDKKLPIRERYLGCLVGLACGDAVGASVVHKSRGSFPKLTEMIGGGECRLSPGRWTAPTSMTLCLASSLTRKLNIDEKRFDPIDQINRYTTWYETEHKGSIEQCVGISSAVPAALAIYRKTGNPLSGSVSSDTADNGSVVRIAPVAMLYLSQTEKVCEYAELSSKTTHGAQDAIDACHLFSLMLIRALSGASKEDIIFRTLPQRKLTQRITEIYQGKYTEKQISEIKSSSKVNESLEAALWCFYHTNTFREAVLMSANLGDDANTTSAICGQLAGAFYGFSALPQVWIHIIAKRDFIINTARELYLLSTTENL